MIGTAALAGTKALLFGILRRVKEKRVVSQWPAGGTGRATVNLSGTDGENERAVGLAVTMQRRLPVAIRKLRRNRRRREVFW